MDDKYIYQLDANRDDLVQQIQMNSIIDQLYTYKVINTEEYQEIEQEGSETRKVRYLLDILKGKDNAAFQNFCKSLEKDYLWLAKELKNVNKFSDLVYENALTRANIPREPPHYVVRTKQLNELKERLKKLKRGTFLTLHGMPCAGKSCLAIAAVKDPELVGTYFKNRMFWVNAGDSPNETELITELLKLYYTITFTNNSSTLTSSPNSDYISSSSGSSTSSNGVVKAARITGTRHSIYAADSLQFVQHQLRLEFTKESLRDALIILDDVHSKAVIDAFDFGCKVLVTTRDKSVTKEKKTVKENTNFDFSYMEIKEGFTDEETLQLFSQSIGVPVHELPKKKSHEINKLCKGNPMLIALIGSNLEEHKEDVKHNDDRWDHYISKLKIKGSLSLDDKLKETVAMCLHDLDNDLKERYQSLAVFVNDVNIMPKTLQTMWSLSSKYAVEDIMSKLKNKSLVVSSFNTQLRCYVYGIHDLLLTYLKEQLTRNERIRLHKSLIDKYERQCSNNFALLPDDNYIFSYIGYHLYQAELWSYFPKLYLDLNFIGTKIKTVGAADLLIDYQRYRPQIINHSDFNAQLLDEFEQFVQENGQHLKKNPHLNVVQCALKQPETSEIYKMAKDIVMKSPNQLYFQIKYEQQTKCKTCLLDSRERITVARFTENINQLLVGDIKGVISLWDQNYKRFLYKFTGHTDRINDIIRNPSKDDEFLSTSSDGSVKIWKLNFTPYHSYNRCSSMDENEGNNGHRTSSPRIRQPNWNNMFSNDNVESQNDDYSSVLTLIVPPVDENNKSPTILCASYSNNGKLIVTGSDTGTLTLWNSEMGKMLYNMEDFMAKPINCCQFSSDDCLVLYSCEKNIVLNSVESGCQIATFNNMYNVIQLLSIPNKNGLIAISNELVKIHRWEYGIHSSQATDLLVKSCNNSGLKTMGTNFSQIEYVCGVITLNGKYLFVVDNVNKVRVWNLETEALVQQLDLNSKIICLDSFSNDDDIQILLSISEDKVVKQWSLHAEHLSNFNKIKLKELFAAEYKEKEVRLAVVDNINNVYIYENLNEKFILPSEKKQPITALTIRGNKVAIGYKNGEIKQYTIDNGNTLIRSQWNMLLAENEAVEYLEYLNDCLVAGGELGSLMIRNNYSNKKLIDSTAFSAIGLNKDRRKPIIKCFIYNNNYNFNILSFISISNNCVVKYWKVPLADDTTKQNGSNIEDVLIASNKSCLVTMASLHDDKIAFTDTDGLFTVYKLKENKASFDHEHNLGIKLTTCCFSPDGQLLAIGQDDGNIIIWCLNNKIMLDRLELHRSTVRSIQFSRSNSPMLMTTVGDQIAWWNVTQIKDSALYSLQSNNKRRMFISKSYDSIPKRPCKPVFPEIDIVWQKKCSSGKKLLACIKPNGSFATHCQMSDDFSSFTMVDDSGLIYIMKVFK